MAESFRRGSAPPGAELTGDRAVAGAPSARPARGEAESRSAGLDGLRAVAVAAVVVYHVNGGWLPGGYLGVDVFFVISGYLITSLLLARRATPTRPRFGDFWARRARRLLPELLVVIAATAFVSGVIGGSATVGLRGDTLASLCYVSNWWFAHANVAYFARFGAPPALLHLWSLGVEEQFYLLWPLLLAGVLALTFRVRRSWVAGTPDGMAPAAVVPLLLAIASFTAMACCYHPGGDPSRVYYGTDTHAGGLLFGATVALLWPLDRARRFDRAVRHRLSMVGTAGLAVFVIAASSLSGDGTFAYRGGIALVSMACLPVCLAAATPSGLARVLSVQPLVWIGRRSYGIYLWHWPVIVLLCDVTRRPAGAAWLYPIELVLPVLLAAASYRWVHQPVRRLGWRGVWSAALARFDDGEAGRDWVAPVRVGVAAAVLAVATQAVLTAPGSSPLQSQTQAGQAAVSASRLAGGSQDRAATATSVRHIGVGACTGASGVSGDDVTAIGDSVMLASAVSLLHELPGISIDAKIGRQMGAAPVVLRGLAAAGQLRGVLVVGLGTNGDFDSDVLSDIAAVAGPRRLIAFVSVYVPDPWQDPVNSQLAAFVAAHANTVLVPWYQAASTHTDLLWSDDTHPQPAGGQLYAATLKSTLAGALARRCG